jgi:hypothetical protein
MLPEILEKFAESCRAIEFLHMHGENHGDIRRDHLWLEQGTGNYVWIDFDYTYEFQENPFGLDIFGLGNLLLYLVGKKFCTTFNIPAPGFRRQARRIPRSLRLFPAFQAPPGQPAQGLPLCAPLAEQCAHALFLHFRGVLFHCRRTA